MNKEVTIPNYTYFGAKMVCLELHKFTENDDVSYNVVMTTILDDETEEEKMVSTITNFWHEDPKTAAIDAAVLLFPMFDLSSLVAVIDGATGNIVEELNLDNIVEEYKLANGIAEESVVLH